MMDGSYKIACLGLVSVRRMTIGAWLAADERTIACSVTGVFQQLLKPGEAANCLCIA